MVRRGFVLFLVATLIYLVGVRVLEWVTGEVFQSWSYLWVFLTHLVLGGLGVVLLWGLGISRLRRVPAHGDVPRGGAFGLLAVGSILLVTGALLLAPLRSGASIVFWTHCLAAVLAARLCWRGGDPVFARGGVAAVAALVIVLAALHRYDPPQHEAAATEEPADFAPSLVRTATGGFIPQRALTRTAYCAECHEYSHLTWSASAHRFSSFDNPVYLFALRSAYRESTDPEHGRRVLRFCGGCHDPVPLLSGVLEGLDFDSATLDDDVVSAGRAGVTCTVCHAMTAVNSVRGNGDYTIEEPVRYPFADSEHGGLRRLSRWLIQVKPGLHRQTFLKPLHRSPEFCSSCHKLHIPEELNGSGWVRGLNHYDSYHLSGVSGHGVTSFYFPQRAVDTCAECHMQEIGSIESYPPDFPGSERSAALDHQFPSADMAISSFSDLPAWVDDRHREFNRGAMRLDLFGLRRGGVESGELAAPLRPSVPPLVRGEPYLLEVVVRSLETGHLFTEGSVESNQVWLSVKVSSGDEVLATSGSIDQRGIVDPRAHFVNAYVIDREGRRIARGNIQDAFARVYDHQIPPAAADLVRYRFDVPETAVSEVTVEAELLYRKFDRRLLRLVHGEDDAPALPIMVLASDRVTFSVARDAEEAEAREIPEWERWNDYGIGLLRAGSATSGSRSRALLRQAEDAFLRVEASGRADGPLNLARVHLAQGAVRDTTISALDRAVALDPPAPRWSVAWLSGLANRRNGFHEEAIADFESILEPDGEERLRGFDFSQDYRLLDEVGWTVFELARNARGFKDSDRRRQLLTRALGYFEAVLELDPENSGAHVGLAEVCSLLGEADRAAEHENLASRFAPDLEAEARALFRHRSRGNVARPDTDWDRIYALEPIAKAAAPPSP